MFSVPESQVQLGPRDGGTDSRIFFLGLHRDTNPGRIHILQAGCKQVAYRRHSLRIIIHTTQPFGRLSIFIYCIFCFVFCFLAWLSFPLTSFIYRPILFSFFVILKIVGNEHEHVLMPWSAKSKSNRQGDAYSIKMAPLLSELGIGWAIHSHRLSIKAVDSLLHWSDSSCRGGWQPWSSRCQGFLPPVNEFPGGGGANLSLSQGMETRPCPVAKGFNSHEHCQCVTHHNYAILLHRHYRLILSYIFECWYATMAINGSCNRYEHKAKMLPHIDQH